MIIAELIEQLSKMDLTLTVYAETDMEVSPIHKIDRDQFLEDDIGLVEAVVLVATEPNAPGGPPIGDQARPASPPEVQPGVEGHDHGEARS
jgi:hypothetical protein